MDEVEFREILRLGLGRAILYARSHDMRPFRDLILDACQHGYSLDFVCERTQGYNMYDLVGCLTRIFIGMKSCKRCKGAVTTRTRPSAFTSRRASRSMETKRRSERCMSTTIPAQGWVN